jgi:hypothetical protein
LAVAVGQADEAEEQRTLRDMRCLREVQENPLDACRQVLQRQLTGRTGTGYGSFQWITGLRTQCCQQLLDVSRECRCAAIRRMVRGYEQTMPPLEGAAAAREDCARSKDRATRPGAVARWGGNGGRKAEGREDKDVVAVAVS